MEGKAHVLGHGEVGKEGVVLKHQANASPLQGQVEVVFRIEKQPSIQFNAPTLGGFQPGQAAQQLAFAGPRRPQDREPAAGALELQLQ